MGGRGQRGGQVGHGGPAEGGGDGRVCVRACACVHASSQCRDTHSSVVMRISPTASVALRSQQTKGFSSLAQVGGDKSGQVLL